MVATTAIAQDVLPGAADLSHLRGTLATWSPDACAFVIAVVNGDMPTVLYHGNDTNGKPVRPQTYTPVGSLARLLVADALDVKFHGKLDVPAGATVAGKKPSALDLLLGGHSDANLLPDYWDWRSDSPPVTTTTILACADVAAEAGVTFGVDRAGMSDLMLLEPFVLQGEGKDWPEFLRATLSPPVSGFDPRDAALVSDDEWATLSVSSTIAKHAKPAPLRLMITAKDLANWWQWRIQKPMPLWSGFRMGSHGKARRRDEIETWEFEDFGNRPVKTLAVAYPQQRSGILCVSVGPPKWIPGQDDALAGAFEADLFGEVEEPAQQALGGRLGMRGANAPLEDWVGKTWVASDASRPCVIRVENATHRGLRLEFGGQTIPSVQALPEGNAMRVVMGIDNLHGGVLWMCPHTNVGQPESLVAVFVEWNAVSTVPHLLRLVAKDDK
ncbi:MAG: hypothetical protein U1E73_12055 [Planctomycetota bacterium]